jgi:hypothetical protein
MINSLFAELMTFSGADDAFALANFLFSFSSNRISTSIYNQQSVRLLSSDRPEDTSLKD